MTQTSSNKRDANLLVLENFNSGYKTFIPKFQDIFNVVSPERVDEQFGITAADGAIEAVAESAAYPKVDIEEIGGTTHSQVVYKKAISVTKLMKRFDNYGTVMNEAYKLGFSARYRMDKVGADVFNGVETLPTWDGLSIANENHRVGNLPGQFQSNIINGGLSTSTLNDGYVKFTNMKDHAGQEMPLAPKKLIVSPSNAKLAHELLVSRDKPDTADRATNWLSTWDTEIVVWSLLNQPQNYHLMADKGFHRFMYLPGIEPTLTPTKDTDTGSDLVQLDFAVTAGAADYLGYIYGKQS